MSNIISKQEALALLRYWKQQGHSLLPLFRVQQESMHRLVIRLPDYKSNQWFTVAGSYAGYEAALADFGKWLDGLQSVRALHSNAAIAGAV